MRLRNLTLIAANIVAAHSLFAANNAEGAKRPNVIFIFADQLRAQALGYAGDENIVTPNIDKLANESVNFNYAISGVPVSTPYRGIMLTGQFPLNNGMFMNDIQLDPKANSAGKIFKAAGYETGYIGKWHINGNGRTKYIPKENRQGFDYFKALECTHDYLNSPYYDNDNPQMKHWEGYDAIDQTKDAIKYIEDKSQSDKPFVLYLSWGTPHNPYDTAPQRFKDLYADKEIKLRENVPQEKIKSTIKNLKGYYAHTSALDECIGKIEDAVKELGIEDNTIIVFTSDHGDMLGSQGFERKQRPYDESIRVPFLVKYPEKLGKNGVKTDVMLDSPDILPTLLGLADIDIPTSIDGENLAPILLGEKRDKRDALLIQCITPYGEYRRNFGGKEYRGIRTREYTYVRDLNGPWLLFDNINDPYQMNNLIEKEGSSKLQKKLDKKLWSMLKERGDEFLPGEKYIEEWGIEVDATGTVDYKKHDLK